MGKRVKGLDWCGIDYNLKLLSGPDLDRFHPFFFVSFRMQLASLLLLP